MELEPFECIIIGGGPAGLACAIMLGRARRRVLLINSGTPRNAPSHGIHGYLGAEGITPLDLVERGRAEAARYGVEFCDERARSVARRGETFTVETPTRILAALRLVLAYGLRDELPELPRFGEFYGHSIFHCPDCDGYEFSDQPVGVIGSGQKAITLTFRLRQWTRNQCILTHGASAGFSAEMQRLLDAEAVPVYPSPVDQLFGSEGRLTGVRLRDGTSLPLRGLFFSLGKERSASLAEELGCDLDEVEPHVRVDQSQASSVPGVYVVGDLTAGAQMAITAAADGVTAAIAVNKSLLSPEWPVS